MPNPSGFHLVPFASMRPQPLFRMPSDITKYFRAVGIVKRTGPPTPWLIQPLNNNW